MRNFQEQVKKALCHQKLFWPFTVWMNCSSDLKIFENSRPRTTRVKNSRFYLVKRRLRGGGQKLPILRRHNLWTAPKYVDFFTKIVHGMAIFNTLIHLLKIFQYIVDNAAVQSNRPHAYCRGGLLGHSFTFGHSLFLS